MKPSQIAAQLYTVRQFTQNAEDLAQTLKKIKAIGYASVQVSGLGPIEDQVIADLIRGAGLGCCVTHEPGATLLRDPLKAARRLKTLGCRHTAFPIPAGLMQPTPYPGEGKLETLEDVLALAQALDQSGAVLRGEGIQLSYHNHAAEFRRFGGKAMLDIIYDECRPENLMAELDVYWVQAGGADPAAWCRKLKGRLPLIHIKDYAIGPDFKPAFAEVGYGNLDMPAIVAAAEEAGCEWFIVEQDVCPGDPFESLKMSYDYMRSTFCAARRVS